MIVGAVCLQRDGKLMYFLYETTLGRVVSSLRYSTKDLVNDGASRSCNASPEPGEAFVDYDAGINWAVKACRSCRQITFGVDPEESVCYRGSTPQWALGKGLMRPGREKVR